MSEKISPEDFKNALIALSSQDINKKIEAVQTLGFSKKIEAIKPLKKVYSESGTVLKSYARAALKRIEEDLNLERVTLMDEINEKEPEKEEKSSINVSKLIKMIENNDPKIRIGAVQAAAQFNCVDALPHLIKRLELEYHLFVIASLLISIGKLGSSTELEIIYPFLNHDDERIRANAVEAINYIDSSETDLKLLIPLLSDPSERVSTNVAKILSKSDSQNIMENVQEINENMEDSQIDDKEDGNTKKSIELLKSVHKPVVVKKKIKEKEIRKTPVYIYLILLIIILGVPGSYYFFVIKKSDTDIKITETSSETSVIKKIPLEEKLIEIDSKIDEKKYNLAEIQLNLVIRDYKKNDIIKLYTAELLVYKEDFIRAVNLLNNLNLDDKYISRSLYLKARVELGFKNYTDSLKLLDKLLKLKKDKYTEKGKRLKNKIVSSLKKVDDEMIGKVESIFKEYYNLLNENEIEDTKKYFVNKKLFNETKKETWIVFSKAKKLYFLPKKYKIYIDRGRDGMKVSAEVLELCQMIAEGNTPVIIPRFKIYSFNIDDKPLISNITYPNRSKYIKDDLLKNALNYKAVNKDLERSFKILRKTYMENPLDGYKVLQYCETALSLNKLDEIKKALEGNIEKLKFEPEFKFGNNFLKSELYDILANAVLTKKSDKKFLEYLEKGLELNKKNAKILLQLLYRNARKEDLSDYKKYFKKIMIAEPDFPSLDLMFFPELYSKILKVRELIKVSNFRDSMEILTTMKQENSNYWRISYQMGIIFYKLERFDQAISLFEESLKYNPENSDILRNIALSLYKNEEYEEALMRINQCLEKNDSRKNRMARDKIKKEIK